MAIDGEPIDNPLAATSVQGDPGHEVVFFYFRQDVVKQLKSGVVAGLPMSLAEDLVREVTVQVLTAKGFYQRGDLKVVDGGLT